MKYAKLINGELRIAPRKLQNGDTFVYNPPVEMLEEHGYKSLVYTDPPTVEPGYVAVSEWVEEDNDIVQSWHIEEEPDEVDAARAMEILFGGEQ